MPTLKDLQPGDIGFMPIAGHVGAGIKFAQWLLLQTEPDERKICHVFVVADAAGPGGSRRAVEAEPGGAREVVLGYDRAGPGVVYLRPDYQRWLNPESMVNLPYKAAEYGHDVAMAALGYIGTPYSFLDYAAIGGRHLLALRPEDRTPFDRYITTTGHMICSQLADQALSDAGFHVFTDGRLPQDVTPVELYRALRDRPGTQRLILT